MDSDEYKECERLFLKIVGQFPGYQICIFPETTQDAISVGAYSRIDGYLVDSSMKASLQEAVEDLKSKLIDNDTKIPEMEFCSASHLTVGLCLRVNNHFRLYLLAHGKAKALNRK